MWVRVRLRMTVQSAIKAKAQSVQWGGGVMGYIIGPSDRMAFSQNIWPSQHRVGGGDHVTT